MSAKEFRSWRTNDGLSHVVLVSRGDIDVTTPMCAFSLNQTMRRSRIVALEAPTCLCCAAWWHKEF